jgi:hypothetical protein
MGKNKVEIIINKALQGLEEIIKPVLITKASIKEDLCFYDYEINEGPCKGDKLGRKGSLIIHDDLKVAMEKLACFIADIDGAFFHVDKPSTMFDLENHQYTGEYYATGVKIVGTDDNEGYILIGGKWVSHGAIGLETPKIGKASNYIFFDELKAAIDLVRNEVIEYMNGKCAPHLVQAEMEFKAEEKDDSFDKPMD